MHEVVFHYKVIDYQYFMDELHYYEIPDIIEGLKYCNRDEWEMTRMMLAPYAKDIKKSMPLPWDTEGEDTAPVTEEDRQAVINMAKMLERRQQSNI